MVLWALAMTVVLVVWEVQRSSRADIDLAGAAVTLAMGFFLGWRRRGATVFFAPVVSWLFAWLPVWIAAMVRHGFLKGLVYGLLLVTVGWLAIGFGEFVVMGAGVLLARALRGTRPPHDDDVVIFGPNEGR